MPKTLATSGRTSLGPFASYDPDSSCWRTSETTYDLDSEAFSRTLPPSGSMRSGRLSRRATLEPRISGLDSSSSPGLPTPAARDHKGQSLPSREGGLAPPDAVRLLPTPQHSDGTGGPGESTRREGGTNLRTAVTLLPTPTATNAHGNEVNSRGEKLLPGVVKDIPLKLLATPRASDAINGGPNQCNSKGEYDALPGQVHVDRYGKYQAAVDRWESVYKRPAPEPTLPDGRSGNHRLNPMFAAWMMGIDWMHLETLTRKQQLMAIGNAVCPQQGAHAIRGLLARKAAS